MQKEAFNLFIKKLVVLIAQNSKVELPFSEILQYVPNQTQATIDSIMILEFIHLETGIPKMTIAEWADIALKEKREDLYEREQERPRKDRPGYSGFEESDA